MPSGSFSPHAGRWSHLVQLYESGQWRHLYKEEAFAEAVRQARQAVDTWTDAMAEAKAKANAI